MRKIGTILIISGAVMCSTMYVARANADATCKQNATDSYLACAAQCKSDFIDAKLTCRNIQPACGEACLAGRQQCFDNVETIKETGQVPGGTTLDNCSGGTDACKAAFRQQASDCGAPCNGDQTCQECVDQAQVTRFLCRDACGDSFRRNPIVISMEQNCRSSFHACVHACPPAN
jgi:hypothetical protein